MQPPNAIRVERRVDHLLAERAAFGDFGLVVLVLGADQRLPASMIAAGRRGSHLS